MLSAEPMTLPPDAAAEAKEYLRIAGSDEDALTARLMLVAASLCERFIRRALIVRLFEEVVPARTAWTRLSPTPVRGIFEVAALPAEGAAVLLPSDAYAIDVDANGDGWVRLTAPVDAGRIRVRFEAGMAEEWPELPEPLRQGAVRLAAHLYTHRDDPEGAGPPAAVTALWRPYRRVGLGGPSTLPGRI